MKQISDIAFTVFSPEQFRKMSACKVVVPDTYDEDGYPISDGLADLKMGVIDPGLKCKTDGGRMRESTGHFGHIELVRPAVHPLFAKFVYSFLKATCYKCGESLDEDKHYEDITTKQCDKCGATQKELKFIKPTTFFEGERRILPTELRERLERISDENLKRWGISVRPEWLVLTVLPIPPVTMRPSITLETGERSEDDLTHKLVDIIRINQRLGENIDAGAPQLIIEDLWELLQYHVSTYFDNETAGLPPARHRSGRQLRTIVQRLKGKEGRFRYNLSGKRVNFSARTVISPDPYLGINELGVPKEIAAELTVPLNVTKWNLESVKVFLKKHSDKINYIIRTDGRKKKLTQENLEEVLTELIPGYVVERQLMDGDYLIFNRQPSLHRVSMMAHKAKILSAKTFRFNTAVCTPYNADFDGDEMNVHVPQNEEAMAESELLMKVEQNILSPRNGEALVGPTHDHHSGTYLLTQDNLKIPKDYACRLLSIAGIEQEFDGNTIDGKKLFSMLLPKELSLEFKNRSGEEIIIEKGILKKGHIDSRGNERIVKELYNLDPAKATIYIDGISKISVEITLMYGLTLSLSDYELSDLAQKEIRDHYRTAKKKISDLIEKYKTKKLDRQPGKTLRETLEEFVMGIAEDVRDDSAKLILKHVKRDTVNFFTAPIQLNPALLMARSGARGSMLNVIQMTGLVGQQAVRGKRMTSGYKYRLLPHFKQKDLGDEAKGLVNRSFVDGLTPIQYFFHAAGGRDSVVDKGVNPAKTGYMQRRLINALQDFIIDKDMSVKDAEENIVEFSYQSQDDDETFYPGEPVGVIAAQSIGEPGTQMTLRTFHYAGVASLAQLGFTRLVEIVDGRKTPKNPVMDVVLKDKYAKNYDKVKEIAAKIEEITLEKIAKVKENFTKKTIQIEIAKDLTKQLNLTSKDTDEALKKEKFEYEKNDEGFILKFKEATLKEIRKAKVKLDKMLVRGVSGITRAIIIDKKDGTYSIATEGTNLEEVMKIEEVDASKTTTNDSMEVGRVLGVEAARNSIYNEIKKVLDAQGLKVSSRHLSLIADAMTMMGDITSIGRHGLAGKKKSVLARAAFEETAKHLVNAAIEGEKDTLNGITENIIIGQIIPAGTGKVKLGMKIS